MRYLKNNLKNLFVISFCAIIFAVVFYLYSIPLKAVLYAYLLCFVFVSILILCGYIKFRKKDKLLQKAQENIMLSVDLLPDANGVLENQYTSLIKQFSMEYNKLVNKTDVSKTEMTDFYSLWVHQIKTPISAMSLLLQEDSSQKNKILAQELFKIEQYTDLVLGYLRIDDISSDLLLKRYELDKIVKKSVKKYSIIFISKKIGIDMKNTEKTVVTDEKWLGFVIEQILSNSLKYTNSGVISIYMENDNLIIKDTGIGIKNEDLPRIFEKNFTGFNGRMDKKSTGLGLYLCKKTLDKLHHKITVESEQDTGTTVTINLSQRKTFHD